MALRPVDASTRPESWMAPAARAALEEALALHPTGLLILYETDDGVGRMPFPASLAIARGMLEYAIDDLRDEE